MHETFSPEAMIDAASQHSFPPYPVNFRAAGGVSKREKEFEQEIKCILHDTFFIKTLIRPKWF